MKLPSQETVEALREAAHRLNQQLPSPVDDSVLLKEAADLIERQQKEIVHVRTEWDSCCSRERSTFAELLERREQVRTLEQEQVALTDEAERVHNTVAPMLEQVFAEKRSAEAEIVRLREALDNYELRVEAVWDRWREGLTGERGFSHSDGLQFVQMLRALRVRSR